MQYSSYIGMCIYHKKFTANIEHFLKNNLGLIVVVGAEHLSSKSCVSAPDPNRSAL